MQTHKLVESRVASRLIVLDQPGPIRLRYSVGVHDDGANRRRDWLELFACHVSVKMHKHRCNARATPQTATRRSRGSEDRLQRLCVARSPQHPRPRYPRKRPPTSQLRSHLRCTMGRGNPQGRRPPNMWGPNRCSPVRDCSIRMSRGPDARRHSGQDQGDSEISGAPRHSSDCDPRSKYGPSQSRPTAASTHPLGAQNRRNSGR